ncbi:MAG: hypothetical protein JSW07_19150 [bacterium]|nr:MAG: hypothetical protein JSW07_19150 [bacterium]
MQSFDQFTLLGTPAHLSLVKILLILMFLLHLPYIGMFIGSSFFSMFFNYSGRRKNNTMHTTFAKDLIDTVAFNKGIGIVLGVLPLLVITLIYSQILYLGNATPLYYLIYSFLPIILGLIFVYIYKYSFNLHKMIFTLVGVLGALLLIIGYFVFVASITRFHDPEKWKFVTTPVRLLIGWNVIANFLIFLTSSFAITGVGIIFFFFKWSDKLKNADTMYVEYIKKFGLLMALIFTLLIPLFLIWYLINLPDIAFSNTLLIMSIILMLILAYITNLISKMLQQSHTNFGTYAFVLFIMAFLVMILNNGIARENSLREHTKALAIKSEIMLAEILPERAIEEGGGITDYAKGEDVFKRVCSSCHRFDQKIVGPPYNTVLSKYEDNIQKLIAFISKPEKVNPDYPPMPNLGLKITEVEAVAGYLLKSYQEEYK